MQSCGVEMEPSEIIAELFNANCLIATNNLYGKKCVTLVEPGAPDSSVEIRHLPDDAIVIDLDASFANDKLFQSGTGRGVCKRNDFLIISAEEKCAIFLEMKRSSVSGTDLSKQLLGGSCVFDYCCCIVKEFFGESFLKDFKRRFVALLDTAAAKTPTKSVVSPLHDSPERYLRLKGRKTLQFHQLARLTA